MKQSKSIAPVICPYCGKSELAFITENHKCLILRILFYIGLLLTVGFAIRFFDITFWEQEQDYHDIFFILLIISMELTILCRAIISIKEKKIHTKAICKECGHIWYVD